MISENLSLSRLIIYFFIKEKFKVLSLIAMCMLWGAIPPINSLLLKYLVDNISTMKVNILNITFTWAFIYFIWWESLNLFNRLYDYIYLKTLPVIVGNVLEEITAYTELHSQKFFNKNYIGDLSQKISLSALAIEEFFAIIVEKILIKIFLILASAVTLYYINPIICLIFIIWVLYFLIIYLIQHKKSNHMSHQYANKYNQAIGVTIDILSNISTVRMFDGYKNEEKYLGQRVKGFIEKYQNLQLFMTKTRYFQSLSCSIMIFIMIYFMSSQVSTSSGDYVLVISLCTVVADYIRDLIQETSDMYQKVGVLRQCQELLISHEIKNKNNATNLIIKEGKIEYRKVYFQYQKSNALFYDKSIIINAKEKIGLVGFSGSGKTTFANLITRIYEVNQGEILIDDQNINDVTLESLRNSVSVIPQNPILFNRTIAENIKYGSDATDEEMIEAAKKSHIHNFIQTLPEKYDSSCGFQGNLLSGGQKQRIVIARAILKNAPILILDEATSSLDSITEEQIQDSLKFLMQDKTVIVIAHKLSTLINMDRILVFDNGKIVEDGIHEQLINTGNLYSKFWNSQIRV